MRQFISLSHCVQTMNGMKLMIFQHFCLIRFSLHFNKRHNFGWITQQNGVIGNCHHQCIWIIDGIIDMFNLKARFFFTFSFTFPFAWLLSPRILDFEYIDKKIEGLNASKSIGMSNVALYVYMLRCCMPCYLERLQIYDLYVIDVVALTCVSILPFFICEFTTATTTSDDAIGLKCWKTFMVQ